MRYTDAVLLNDTEARRAIVSDLDTTLVVEAAAGTGKTTELVNRVLAVLGSGRARMSEVVAVTFTEKAAGELKLRLREALERDRASATTDIVRKRLEDALETLEEANVNTIHGFCAELLRERPVEARVDPLFEVLTEPQADRLYSRAFRSWLQEALQDPPEGLRRALRRTASSAYGSGEASGPIDRLRNAGRVLADWRDFDQPWERRPFDRQMAIDRIVAALHHLADLTTQASSQRDNLHVDTGGVRRLSQQIHLEQSFGQRDLDGWEARLVDLTWDYGVRKTRKGSGYLFGKGLTRTEVLAARDAFVDDLQQFRKDADADLAACLQRELAGATARYRALKEKAGALDFCDLLSRARDLIRDNEAVRLHLQRKFTRIFVDEFQDTDPVQSEILLLLAADVPGKLFIVGDPKQAIYRFRGTDIATYWGVSKRLAGAGGRVLQLTTSYRSVPAIQRFVNAVFSQDMIADGSALQPQYVPLSPSRSAEDSQPAIVVLPVPRPYSSHWGLKPSAKAIEKSLPDAVGAFIDWLIDERNGWTVAERSKESGARGADNERLGVGPQAVMKESGARGADNERLGVGGEARVPIQPRHIAVLFRRFVSFGNDLTRGYVDAIEARGIPHLLVGGKAFHGREEVEAIRAALAAIEWPDDELSVFATLKGSLFAVDDEQLLEFRHRFGVFHPFRIPKELGGNSGGELALSGDPTAHLTPIADALRLLQRLHRGRNYRPVAETIGRILDATRAHVGLILRSAGEQALANVLHVAELARQYEAGGGISFRGFIDELRTAAESTDAAEAPIVEEGSDGVRLMTVHKAKGLEFPVVILADLTCPMSRQGASRYLDATRGLCALKLAGWTPHELHDHEAEESARDGAEGIRLAYVAATRARDLLVVPALGDGPWEGGWFAPLNRGIYPPIPARKHATRGPKCPAFKSKDSVSERPQNEVAGPATVCPGQHTFGEKGDVDGELQGDLDRGSPAGYSIVWWDPGPSGGLILDARPTFGVRREDLIVKDVPRNVVADGRSRYDSWRLARLDARGRGSAPSMVVETMRDWAAVNIVDDRHLSLLVGPHPHSPSLGDSAPATPSRRTALGAPAPRESRRRSLPAAVDPSAVMIIDLTADRAGERPGGTGFGLLVHALLARAPFDATRRTLDGLADIERRTLGMTHEDGTAASVLVTRLFEHDVLRAARSADARGVCRREVPVTWTLEDGTIIEGVVDLAFELNGAWTVVDYKTDRDVDVAEEDRYRRQVAFYASAICQATGQPSSAVLIRL